MEKWVEEHKRLIDKYLTSKKYDKSRNLLEEIFREYLFGVRRVYIQWTKRLSIEEPKEFSIRITQIFIKIIDFIYIENFGDKKFSNVFRKKPKTVAGTLFYIIANSTAVIADSPRVTTYDMYSFPLLQPIITKLYKEICKLLGIKFKRWERGINTFSIPSEFTKN